MSGLPPNYDPNVSMLQGGTTSPIQPVMGGGGGPPNYNIDTSLLAGGTGEIVKVLGGGAKTEGNLQGEVYSVNDTDVTKKYREDYLQKLLKEYDAKVNVVKRLLANFLDARVDKIKRYDVSGIAQNPTLPTIDMIRKAAGGPVPNLSAVYDVIPAETESIVMIPPINGDIDKFIQILQHLFKTEIFRRETTSDLRVRNGIAIVCMSPFYSNLITDRQKNLLMFYLHLRLWDANRNSVFVLNSINSFNPGIELYNELGLTDTSLPIFNSMNPSYLIHKKQFGNYKGVLFSSETGQLLESPRKNKNTKFQTPSEISKKYSTFAIQPSLALDDVDTNFNDYLLIGSQGYKSDLIKSRTDVPICKNLLTVFYDEDIQGKTYMVSDKRDEIHVFRFNTIQEPPLLCVTESGETPTYAPPPGNFAGKEKDTRFVKAETKRIVVDALTRRIRLFSPQVYNNWMEGIYSKDEADFLNHLQLTPTVLHFIFDANWKLETANFLKKIVLSDCFSDIRLLTRAECDTTRSFLDKVLDYFYTHAAFKQEDGPIQRIVLPKVVYEEQEAPILEPAGPAIVARRPVTPIATIVWGPDIKDIDEKQFEKDSFGQIKKKVDGDKYVVDFIAIQIESGLHLFKRHEFNIQIIDDEVDKRNKLGGARTISVEEILDEKMKELQTNHPEFTILY